MLLFFFFVQPLRLLKRLIKKKIRADNRSRCRPIKVRLRNTVSNKLQKKLSFFYSEDLTISNWTRHSQPAVTGNCYGFCRVGDPVFSYFPLSRIFLERAPIFCLRQVVGSSTNKFIQLWPETLPSACLWNLPWVFLMGHPSNPQINHIDKGWLTPALSGWSGCQLPSLSSESLKRTREGLLQTLALHNS